MPVTASSLLLIYDDYWHFELFFSFFVTFSYIRIGDSQKLIFTVGITVCLFFPHIC